MTKLKLFSRNSGVAHETKTETVKLNGSGKTLPPAHNVIRPQRYRDQSADISSVQGLVRQGRCCEFDEGEGEAL